MQTQVREFDRVKTEISIIIPIYNAEKTIAECLTSVCIQPFASMEILCVDDGSTDGSAAIVRAIEEKDKRVHYLPKEHSGQGMTRNYGIQAAQGRYVMFMDSDDTLEPDSIEAVWKKAEENQADMVVFGFELVRRNGRRERWSVPDFSGSRRQFMEQRFTEAYKLFLINAPWNKLIRRECLEKNHITFRTDMSLYEDLLFSLEAIQCVEHVVTDSEIRYVYNYMLAGALTSNYFPQTDRYIYIVSDKLEEILLEYPLDKAYFYSDIVHKMVSFASAVRRREKSFWKRLVKICVMFSNQRMTRYLREGRTDIPILRRQICFLRLCRWAMRCVAVLTGNGGEFTDAGDAKRSTAANQRCNTGL